MNLDALYPLVTEAIRRAEVLDDLNAPGARDAHRDVSLLEEEIANLLSASSTEGAIARRGAVRAANAAGDFRRAQELATRFSTEAETSESLRCELDRMSEEASQAATLKGHTTTTGHATRRVFIVHGYDEAAREVVAHFLEGIGLEAIMLPAQATKERTTIAKLREEADDVGFAVVLLTPDEHSGKAGTTADPRQNVIFELGLFIGALGPERVAALTKGQVERPLDLGGVIYIDLDPTGHWRAALGKELRAVGFEIDWSKVMHSY